MTIDEKIAVLEAFKRGETIQFLMPSQGWIDCAGEPLWNFNEYDYRAKPKSREVWCAFNSEGRLFAATDKHQCLPFELVKFREVIE